MIEFLKSLPSLILIVISFELMPIPSMCLDYIRIMIRSGNISKALGTFFFMVLVGLILSLMCGIGVILLLNIWGDYTIEGEE